VGGDSAISADESEYESVLRLGHAFDTLVVTNHKVFHAVTPLSLTSGEIGYRDIFLVTFQEEKDVPENQEELFRV